MRCPLCLKELTSDDELERFCTDHPDKKNAKERFKWSESNSRKIYCLDGKCRYNKFVGMPGVFLRHVGCSVKNPFWVEDEERNDHEPDVGAQGGQPERVEGKDEDTRRFGVTEPELSIEIGEEERRLHNDARRFARLLVSEIKLYNEAKIKEGRSHGDLYERLREDIDRSRQMYNKRVAPAVAARHDYYHQELVNTLADGDPARMGTNYPGAAIENSHGVARENNPSVPSVATKGKDANKVIVPADSADSDSTITCEIKIGGGDSRSVKIDHWEIAMLRMMPPDAPEMWFPLMLMRAMAETTSVGAANVEKKIGVRVELAGVRNVGKTVLAVQAMDQKGYEISQRERRSIEVSDYISSRSKWKEKEENSFLETLYLLNRMRINEMKDGRADVDAPSPTKPEAEPGDLKVAFVKPSNKHIPEGSKPSLFNDLKESLGKVLGLQSTEPPPFWFTVAFYDTAGEIQKKAYSSLRNTIEKAVDKVAILVNAIEVVGDFGRAKNNAEGSQHRPTSENSIQVAVQRIRQVKDRDDLKWCLVVTHIDKVQEGFEREVRSEMAKLIFNPNNNPSDHNKARGLLVTWLSKSPDQNKIDLINLLEIAPPVFFVGTENLPDKNQKYLQHPKTYGLAKFICWCLDIEWEDINQRKVS